MNSSIPLEGKFNTTKTKLYSNQIGISILAALVFFTLLGTGFYLLLLDYLRTT